MPESPSPAHEYWQRTLRLTGWLLVVWFAVTFIAVFFARPLADFVLFGFPVSFYISAQGALLAYGAIVWFYARRMNRWDEVYEKQAETEDDSPDRNEP